MNLERKLLLIELALDNDTKRAMELCSNGEITTTEYLEFSDMVGKAGLEYEKQQILDELKRDKVDNSEGSEKNEVVEQGTIDVEFEQEGTKDKLERELHELEIAIEGNKTLASDLCVDDEISTSQYLKISDLIDSKSPEQLKNQIEFIEKELVEMKQTDPKSNQIKVTKQLKYEPKLEILEQNEPLNKGKVHSKEKFRLKKKKGRYIVGFIMMLILIFMVFFGYMKFFKVKNVDLSSYVNVTFPNNESEAKPVITGIWEEQEVGSEVESDITTSVDSNQIRKVSSIITDYDVSPDEPVKNGDKVTITVNYNAELAKEKRINVVNNVIELTASGMEEYIEPIDIDLANYAVISYDTSQSEVFPVIKGNWEYKAGLDELVTSGIYTKEESYELEHAENSGDVEKIVTGYELSPDTGVVNGDTVNVEIQYDENLAKELNLEVVNNSFEFTIKGLIDNQENDGNGTNNEVVEPSDVSVELLSMANYGSVDAINYAKETGLNYESGDQLEVDESRVFLYRDDTNILYQVFQIHNLNSSEADDSIVVHSTGIINDGHNISLDSNTAKTSSENQDIFSYEKSLGEEYTEIKFK